MQTEIPVKVPEGAEICEIVVVFQAAGRVKPEGSLKFRLRIEHEKPKDDDTEVAATAAKPPLERIFKAMEEKSTPLFALLAKNPDAHFTTASIGKALNWSKAQVANVLGRPTKIAKRLGLQPIGLHQKLARTRTSPARVFMTQAIAVEVRMALAELSGGAK